MATLTRRKEYACPSQLTLDVVGGKWKPLILWLLRDGKARRFNELLAAMPDVTHKVLTSHLRELQRDGIVVRTVASDPRLRVEYSISEFGNTLRPVLNGLALWAKQNHRRYGATIARMR